MSIEDDAAPSKNSVFIDNWVQIGTPAKTWSSRTSELQRSEAVNVSLGNLLSYPFVKERVVKNKLALRGAHYDFVVKERLISGNSTSDHPAFSFS
ncbi:beta carbonic anhydrase 3-like [Brassica napus]|uniref:beta carbonic anhydrase 3-like n=1 Tax=Brassica napus TaxID=3708 RepID=UPI002078B455|nr:beta carbonic anhydrase 3-like [Brassica napus]